MMLAEQRNVCAICKLPNVSDKAFAVDHCHKTGQVRGLLCSRCNLGLGLFQDDEETLREAARYVERFK